MALVFWDDEIIKREIVFLLEQMESIEWYDKLYYCFSIIFL